MVAKTILYMPLNLLTESIVETPLAIQRGKMRGSGKIDRVCLDDKEWKLPRQR